MLPIINADSYLSEISQLQGVYLTRVPILHWFFLLWMLGKVTLFPTLPGFLLKILVVMVIIETG
jgi:hypothetical protein